MDAPRTVTDAVTLYLHTLPPTLSRATVANYARDLREFTDITGDGTLLADLTGPALDTITRLYGNRRDTRYHRPHADRDGTPKTRSPGAQARFRHSVTRLLTHATTAGWIPTNPATTTAYRPRATPVRTARGPVTTATLETIIAAAHAADDTERDLMKLATRDEVILRLLAEHGPTAAQIAATNTTDYDGTTLTFPDVGATPGFTATLSEATTTALNRYLTDERPPPRARVTKTVRADGAKVATTTAGADDASRALLLTWRGRRITARDIQNLVRARVAVLTRPTDRAATPTTLAKHAPDREPAPTG